MTIHTEISKIATAAIGEEVEFIFAGRRVRETVIARRDSLTATKDENGRVHTWWTVTAVPENTGWVHGAISGDEAIDCVLEVERGWAGLARGIQESESV